MEKDQLAISWYIFLQVITYVLLLSHHTQHKIKSMATNGIATQNAMYQSEKESYKEI